MRELSALIETGESDSDPGYGLVTKQMRWKFDCGQTELDDHEDFFEISSQFYPELAAYFDVLIRRCPSELALH